MYAGKESVKLKNETEFNGRDLRGLLLSCARYYEVKLGNGTVVTFAPRKAGNRLSWASRNTRNLTFTLKLCPTKRLIGALDSVSKLAAVSNGGWAQVGQGDFLQLCGIVDWIVSGSNEWPDETPSWAEGRVVRFKVPKVKVKAVGAAYHQEQIDKLNKQIEDWTKNKLKKAEQHLARIQRGIKQRKKDLKYHTKQRDKKQAAE